MKWIALVALLAGSALAEDTQPAPVGTAVPAITKAPSGAIDFVSSDGSVVRYKLVHKFHDVEGVTRAVKSRVRLLPSGVLQVMARAEVGTFDSGNGNRDAHMKEVVEAAKFPWVEVKLVGAGFRPPSSFPATVEIPLKGELTFHGRTHPLSTSAKVTFTDAAHASGDANFPVSLESYQVERPSLAFVKVNDEIVLRAHLIFTGATQ